MTRKKKQKAYLDKYNTEIQYYRGIPLIDDLQHLVRSEYSHVEKVNAKLVIE
ncbi:hypothetical protein [Lactobacillus johnsonii]|uniref:hypothetical protein n=1 Tax=Lactobacillus johnsonii TaxID=33959 RepID=UPI0013C3792A|nr:hypothetical protein [Lactobacillus johnsonii]